MNLKWLVCCCVCFIIFLFQLMFFISCLVCTCYFCLVFSNSSWLTLFSFFQLVSTLFSKARTCLSRFYVLIWVPVLNPFLDSFFYSLFEFLFLNSPFCYSFLYFMMLYFATLVYVFTSKWKWIQICCSCRYLYERGICIYFVCLVYFEFYLW